jgi:ribosomal-protein-alanine N-acetyltransferase
MAIDERLVFHEGKHVRLKVLDESDILESGWVGWFNDEQMCEFNQHHYFPNSFEKQREFLLACQGPEKLQLGIVDRSSPDHICGVVSLSAINLVHRHAEIAGTQAMSQTRANQAIFIESWRFMLKHGFEQLGLQKIYGGTFHPHVLGALKRMFNFEVEGLRKRHVFKHGKHHDVTLVAVHADTVIYPEV